MLQVEFSHSSYDAAAQMQPGEYYTLANMRLKYGGSGCVEGRMQEAHKVQKLDEDALEDQPRLLELLRCALSVSSRAPSGSPLTPAHPLSPTPPQA